MKIFLRPRGEKERAGLLYFSAGILLGGHGECCLSAPRPSPPIPLGAQALLLHLLREGAVADTLNPDRELASIILKALILGEANPTPGFHVGMSQFVLGGGGVMVPCVPVSKEALGDADPRQGGEASSLTRGTCDSFA